MKVGQTSDMINMMLQLLEMETYITPDLNLYSSLVETGLSYLIFGPYPGFLSEIAVVEEFIEITINGLQVKRSSDHGKFRLIYRRGHYQNNDVSHGHSEHLQLDERGS